MPRSYEEFDPYGTTAWQAPSLTTISVKRYRYTRMERDEETGLQRHGVRYYAVWLGRWTSADPIGLGDGVNRYGYVRAQTTRLQDPTGLGERNPEGVGIIVTFPDYQVALPDDVVATTDALGVPRKLPLGHAGVIVADASGKATYYEFGRYDNPQVPGIVRPPRSVGTLKFDDKGEVDASSVKAVLASASKIGGHGGRVQGYLIDELDAVEAKSYAEARRAENASPTKAPYEIVGNSCFSFAKDVAAAGGATMAGLDPNPMPASLDAVLSAAYDTVYYDPKLKGSAAKGGYGITVAPGLAAPREADP